MDRRSGSTWGTIVLVAVLAALGAEAGAAVRIKRTLSSTGVDPDARGQALLVINHHGGRGKLKVKGHKLSGGSTFGIVVGGVRIGTLATNPAGNGHAKFSSQPGHHDQMLGTDPRGKLLEVEDESGEDVLKDEIPDDSVDPAAIACCLTDDDGTECETETPDECQHEGGTATTATSCMPDPCSSTPSGETRCCLPDDHEAECEQMTAAECNDRHGVDVMAGSCDPNPCSSIVPGVVRCCLTDHEDGEESDGHDDGGEPARAECEQLTAEHCGEEGGRALEPGSCDPNPCGSPSGAFLDDGAVLF